MNLKVQTTKDGDYKVIFDETIQLGVKQLIIDFTQRPAVINAEVYMKSCDIDLEGKVKLNGFVVSDHIGREIYNSLKSRYEPSVL